MGRRIVFDLEMGSMNNERALAIVASAKSLLRRRFPCFDSATREDMAHEVLVYILAYEIEHGKPYTRPLFFAVINVLRVRHSTRHGVGRLRSNEHNAYESLERVEDCGDTWAAEHEIDAHDSVERILGTFSERDRRIVQKYLETPQSLLMIASKEKLSRTRIADIVETFKVAILESLLPTTITVHGESCR